MAESKPNENIKYEDKKLKHIFFFKEISCYQLCFNSILMNINCKTKKIKILPKNPAKNPAKLIQSCQKILLKWL